MHLLGTIIVILIGIILVFIIGHMIKPITKIQEALTRVAALDLGDNKEIEPFEKRADEIGKLAKETKNNANDLKLAINQFNVD